MNFLCIYLGEKGGGGVALMHVYVWEHIINLYYRTGLWMFMKLGKDEVLIVPYKLVLLFFGHILSGADPGWGQNRSPGSPSSRNFFFRQEGYSNKLNA